jgi:4-hydroxy-tetrahydrodipicolinate synthase
MAKMRIEGSFVAPPTPFNENGAVDHSAYRALLQHLEDNGTVAALIMGSTGEPSLLEPEEKKKIVVETAKMKTGKMKFFYGCTGNTTQQVIDNVISPRLTGPTARSSPPRPISAGPRTTSSVITRKSRTASICRLASTTTRRE